MFRSSQPSSKHWRCEDGSTCQNWNQDKWNTGTVRIRFQKSCAAPETDEENAEQHSPVLVEGVIHRSESCRCFVACGFTGNCGRFLFSLKHLSWISLTTCFSIEPILPTYSSSRAAIFWS
ncbi:hypothetical protein JG687_00016867 [Phytophthora cactorum]|uniref:Uncharacterized protein n=1 Tax=Phytophthora cactorum TaxID=29920 RepID=A0A8T1TSY8_9STRA|nr:hypothetical protein JG687_00016867 [Phytophthora cactorum]